MTYKKCGKCDTDNFKSKSTIFDGSKRKENFGTAFDYDFLCEGHFLEDQITVYSNGIKK